MNFFIEVSRAIPTYFVPYQGAGAGVFPNDGVFSFSKPPLPSNHESSTSQLYFTVPIYAPVWSVVFSQSSESAEMIQILHFDGKMRVLLIISTFSLLSPELGALKICNSSYTYIKHKSSLHTKSHNFSLILSSLILSYIRTSLPPQT